MSLSAPLLLDLVILVLLVLFIVQGVRRGFILTLCSLLAVFLALVGGWFLTQQYAEPLQEKLEPVIIAHFAPEYDKPAEAQEDLSLSETVQAQMEASVQSIQAAVIAQQCRAMASLASKVILFLGGFLAVLLLWIILCRALDLVARLPGLHLMNKVLGGILGLLKGLILLMVLRWLCCDLFSLIPDQIQEESRLLPVLSYLTVFYLPGR